MGNNLHSITGNLKHDCNREAFFDCLFVGGYLAIHHPHYFHHQLHIQGHYHLGYERPFVQC